MPLETSLQATPRSRGLCRLMILLPFYKWGAPTSPGKRTSRVVSISLLLKSTVHLYYIIGSKMDPFENNRWMFCSVHCCTVQTGLGRSCDGAARCCNRTAIVSGPAQHVALRVVGVPRQAAAV